MALSIHRGLVALMAASLLATACTAKPETLINIKQVGDSASSGLKALLNATVLAPANLGSGNNIVSTYGGGIVSTYGGGIISTYGGGLVSQQPASFGLLAVVDKLKPVKNALVSVQDLSGKTIASATTDDQGQCRWDKLPRNTIFTLRTQIEVEGKGYYLSNLTATENASTDAMVDPIGTLIEAKFFTILAGKSLKTRTVSFALLKKLWAEVNALEVDIPVAMLDGSKTQADLVAFYDELSKQHPSLKPAIDELFLKINEGV